MAGRSESDNAGDNPDDGIDVDAIVQTLDRHPIRCAVLYGSHVQGTTTRESDVDIAVEFADEFTPAERLQRRIDLVVDLVDALGTDDVDVVDLASVRPEVGLAALETGDILVGDHRVETHRDRFEREVVTPRTHRERMQRLDAILDRLEEQV